MSNPSIKSWSPTDTGVIMGPTRATSGMPTGVLQALADDATSVLQRDRVLKGKSLEYISEKSKIDLSRLKRLESGTAVGLLPGEAAGLKNAGFIDDPAVLIAPATPENIARQKPVI